MSTFVFRYRFWLFAAVFFLGQALYAVDPVNVVVWLLRSAAPSLDLDSDAGRTALRVVFSLGAFATVLCAAIRTWATAYLRSDIVHDTRIHTEALVANGPYRYVRNPLYLGGLLLGVGLALLASRVGFVVTVAGVTAITLALIQSEERMLAGSHSESYAAYRRAVPRLIPSLVPRVPAGTAKPRWRQAIVGEMFMWIFAAGMIAFVITLQGRVAAWVSVAGVVFQIVFGAVLRARRAATAAALLAGLAVLVGSRPVAAQVVDQPTFDWTGPARAGGTVRVLTSDGNIAVSQSSGPTIEVHGERTNVMSGGRALVFEVTTSGSDIVICARERNGRCEAGGIHDGPQFARVGKVGSANLTVRIPAGLKLVAHSGDGNVDVRNAGSDVSVTSGDGSIHVTSVNGMVRAHSGDGDVTLDDVSGTINAKSGDGPIIIRVGATGGDPQISAHSGDGPVTVYLPATVGGQLSASTGSGAIDSDFPIQVNGRFSSHHGTATLGTGGSARVDISTGDGSITVRKL